MAFAQHPHAPHWLPGALFPGPSLALSLTPGQSGWKSVPSGRWPQAPSQPPSTGLEQGARQQKISIFQTGIREQSQGGCSSIPPTTNPSTCNYTDLATSARTSSGIWNTFLASWTTATRGANATVPINFIYTGGSKGTGRGLAFVDIYDGKERK